MKTNHAYTKIGLLLLGAAMFTVASARADTVLVDKLPIRHRRCSATRRSKPCQSLGHVCLGAERHDLGQRQRHRCFDPLRARRHRTFTGRDDSDRRAEQRSRQSHWTSPQQHPVLPSDEKWKLGTRFFHFCQ